MSGKKRITAFLTAVFMMFSMVSIVLADDDGEAKIDLREQNVKIITWDDVYEDSAVWTIPDVVITGEDGEEIYLDFDEGDYTYLVTDTDGNEIDKITAGTFIMSITGTGRYEGTITREFTVAKASQKVTVSTTKFTKFYGDKKFKITAKRTMGNGRITFKSSNAKAAAVSSAGVVTIKKVKKKTAVKISVYAAATANFKKSPVKTVTVTVYPKQKTPKKYRKYLGKWVDNDFKMKVYVANKNYLHAKIKAKDGDYVVIKKLMNTKKKHTLHLKSKKGRDVTLIFKLYCSKPATQPNGIRIMFGPKYWCAGKGAWKNGTWILNVNGKQKKLITTFYRILN